MPQVANIVINDGAAVPVAFTYAPMGKDGKGVWWYEQITPAPINPLGANRIGVKLDRAALNGKLTGMARVTITTYEPVLETLGNASTGITPPPTVAYKRASRLTYDVSERSTKQERKDTRTRSMNLLANAQIVSVVDDLQALFG